MTEIVGRESELVSLREFVVGIAGGASALVLEGEAGMGKTTLWSAGIQEAETSGVRVLRALPAESESALSFAGVGDLLDSVLDEALVPLPAGQRRALSRALVLDDDEGPTPDPHAVGVALLNALRALADARPLLVSVDDVFKKIRLSRESVIKKKEKKDETDASKSTGDAAANPALPGATIPGLPPIPAATE